MSRPAAGGAASWLPEPCRPCACHRRIVLRLDASESGRMKCVGRNAVQATGDNVDRMEKGGSESEGDVGASTNESCCWVAGNSRGAVGARHRHVSCPSNAVGMLVLAAAAAPGPTRRAGTWTRPTYNQ
eukprot:scaffold12243_cov116-Isochrysis_galbana.AAC.2